MDTTILRRVLEADGPFASVHFEDTHDTQDAAKQLELRLREIGETLTGQGADPATVDALNRAVLDSPRSTGRSGRSIVAADGDVLLHERLAEPPGGPFARFSELPYLLPLAAHTEPLPTYLVVLVDHVGADITVFGPRRQPLDSETVTGREHPVHKVRGGGTSHRDIQAHADETAHHNLTDVAAEVTKTAERVKAGLVILAGEVQARTGLRELLPRAIQDIATDITAGARSAGSSEDIGKQIDEVLTGRRLAALDDVAERYRAALGGPEGLAVGGLEGVTTALTEANVETLLVGDPGDATVLTDPAPIHAAGTSEQQLGGGPAIRRGADEALPYLALATGADLVVMDDRLPLTEGFGALLRHG
ncbi:hypothetical protein [Amycolatopsis sp. NPDC059021]|uniref:Rv2629 family ribosome hibernation factor n=1 Tax=Amycolatopsis sp. NPDC059021 TaxID=3346704 RepID=UPI00366F1EA6